MNCFLLAWSLLYDHGRFSIATTLILVPLQEINAVERRKLLTSALPLSGKETFQTSQLNFP